MLTLTMSIRRRTVRMLAVLFLIYIASYGACRTTGLLVHAAQNRYTAGSTHDV